MEEKLYECTHLRLIKEEEKFITAEREGNIIYYYYYNEEELIKLKIPIDDFAKLVIEEVFKNGKNNRD